MPTYDYMCEECRYTVEMYHSILDKFEIKCPKCNGQMIKQVGGTCYTKFIGDGFHCNDYPAKEGEEK